MAIRGKNSKSFLRERGDYVASVGKFLNVDDLDAEYDFETMLHLKDSNGKYVYGKAKIFTLTENLGYNRHIVVNAKNLLGMSHEKINLIIANFKDHLEDFGISGILEFHANDMTQKSFHFHFWTNNDSPHIRQVLYDFVLEKKLADADNVEIQGKYKDFKTMEAEAQNSKDLKEVRADIDTLKKVKVAKAIDLVSDTVKEVYKENPKRAMSFITRMKQRAEETHKAVDKLLNGADEIENIIEANEDNIESIFESITKRSEEIQKANQAILKRR